jgi:hypothetical protein
MAPVIVVGRQGNTSRSLDASPMGLKRSLRHWVRSPPLGRRWVAAREPSGPRFGTATTRKRECSTPLCKATTLSYSTRSPATIVSSPRFIHFHVTIVSDGASARGPADAPGLRLSVAIAPLLVRPPSYSSSFAFARYMLCACAHSGCAGYPVVLVRYFVSSAFRLSPLAHSPGISSRHLVPFGAKESSTSPPSSKGISSRIMLVP